MDAVNAIIALSPCYKGNYNYSAWVNSITLIALSPCYKGNYNVKSQDMQKIELH